MLPVFLPKLEKRNLVIVPEVILKKSKKSEKKTFYFCFDRKNAAFSFHITCTRISPVKSLRLPHFAFRISGQASSSHYINVVLVRWPDKKKTNNNHREIRGTQENLNWILFACGFPFIKCNTLSLQMVKKGTKVFRLSTLVSPLQIFIHTTNASVANFMSKNEPAQSHHN